MSSVAHTLPSAVSTQARVEVWFGRVLLVLSVLAGVSLLCFFAKIFWTQNETTQVESVIAGQALMLARDGTLYYDLNRYPYTVAAYTPIYYWLEAGLSKAGVPVYQAGRLLSFAALLGIFALTWRLLLLYTGDRNCAGTGAVLCMSTSLLTSWGTVAQTDTLAIFFGIAAFYQYSRYAIEGRNSLIAAGAFVIAAFFTKQTMVACPAAIFVLLWLKSPKLALQFAASVGGILIAVSLAINTALGGRFLADTVLANMNPFAFEKFSQHIGYAAVAAGQMVIIAAAGARQAWRGHGRAIFIYLGMAMAVLAVTAPKIGSDSNYQIESTILLILCGCLALHALKFFELLFRGSKTWITLLQIPLLMHVVLNYRIAAPGFLGTVSKEQQFRSQVAALGPHLADGGRVISTDLNVMIKFRGRIEVEPLIYKLLVASGVVDPEPVRRDIAARVFSTIILFEDVNRHEFDMHTEIPTLPPVQIAEVRKHYRLVEQVPGPYVNGVYVYKPVR